MKFLNPAIAAIDRFSSKLMLAYYDNLAIKHPIEPRPHGLGRPLAVNLTSYPPRFATLHLTLDSLLKQEVRPDAIRLWIARDDFADLPLEVLKYGKRIEIRPTDDLRSYKKLVPALAEHAEEFNVVVDDDAYYNRYWLRQLVEGYDPANPSSVCHIAFRIRSGADGLPLPYMQWKFDVRDERARLISGDLLPIGLGGVLYPPNAFHEDATRVALFQELAPDADDLWFFAMARLNGLATKKVGPRFLPILWPGTRENSLWQNNRGVLNDRAIAKLVDRYGPALFDTQATPLTLQPTTPVASHDPVLVP
ncbi:hypothetical protein K3172_15125 [Qipengyuania sp. 6B39]|uniref:hypothetical protein n=1 Tax=Qipengyuania proteolytica TaxID=2867239 RepID=UPI001C89F39A|nr:hypothetical protein [Qipengyuania proteolytica]MBX7497190.1 hypothetical protein [Qipengyuania proteolytica]